MKTLAVIAVLTSTLGITAASARADHDVDELANTLDRQAEQIARTIYTGFRHTPEFNHLYRDAYELHELAHHIHEIAHHGTTYNHMRSDMEQFDRLFSHFVATVEGLDDHALPLPAPHAIGGIFRGVSHGHGSHVDPRQLSRLCALLDQTAQTVSCLKAEICGPVARPLPAVLPSPASRPVIVPRPVTPVIGPQFPGAARPIFQTKKGGFSFSLTLAK